MGRKKLPKGWTEGSVQELFDLTDQEAAIVEMRVRLAERVRKRQRSQRIAQDDFARRMRPRHDIGDAPVKSASNRGSRDLQLGEQLLIAALADHFSNALVVSTSSAEGCHQIRIGRPNNRCIPRKSSMNRETSQPQRPHLQVSRETAARVTMVRRHDPRVRKRLGRHSEAGPPRATSRARPLCASSSSV